MLLWVVYRAFMSHLWYLSIWVYHILLWMDILGYLQLLVISNIQLLVNSNIRKCFYGHSFFFFLLFRATCVAYGSSPARRQIRAAAADLCHSHSHSHTTSHPIRTPSLTCTTVHGNTGSRSFSNRARPGIKPAYSWILVRVVTAEPRRELPKRGF